MEEVPPEALEGLPPSHFELASSLEFLSCLKTEQNISIRKIHDVVLPALLHNLSSFIPSVMPDRSSSENGLSRVEAMAHKVQSDLVDIKETFGRLKEWEDRLNTLTKSLMLYDWEGIFSTERENLVDMLEIALPDIDEMVTELKLHTSLPLETSLAPESLSLETYSAAETSSAPESLSLENYSAPESLPLETFSAPESSNSALPVDAVLELKWSRQFSETAFHNDFEARYNRLKPHEQLNFLYFSIFPENSVFRKKFLAYLWIGGGFGEARTRVDVETLEEKADELLGKLNTMGLIQPVGEKGTGDFNACTMNPLIRSALIMRALDRDFPHPNNSVNFQEIEGQLVSSCKSDKDWLTLVNVDQSRLDFPIKWFSKAKKNVAVIHLGNWRSSSSSSSSCSISTADNYIEVEDARFLQGLSEARLLRYLSFNGISGITELPASIWKLKSLRILDLKACRNLERLPRRIGSLKLTHLDMSGCFAIESMPKGLASLSDLRVLKGFVVGGSRSCGQCTLDDLVRLRKLRKLGLYADRQATDFDAELTCLSKFRALRILTISWIAVASKSEQGRRDVRRRRRRSRAAAFPSLPADIEKVDLRCWPSASMPDLRDLFHLKKLYIRGGKLSSLQVNMCDFWPRTVKIVRLKFLKELRGDLQEVRTVFPSLVYLEKVECPQLLSFPSDGVWRNEVLEQIFNTGNIRS